LIPISFALPIVISCGGTASKRLPRRLGRTRAALLLLVVLAPGCIVPDEPETVTVSIENGSGETAQLALRRDDQPFTIELSPSEGEKVEVFSCPDRLEFVSLSLGDGDATRTAPYDGAPFRVLERDESFDCGALLRIRVDEANTVLTIEADPPR
jgi:hypothetical protein